MIFSMIVMPVSAANADYTIAENCSVTLVKNDNFKTDDTSVSVSVKLDDRLSITIPFYMSEKNDLSKILQYFLCRHRSV